MPRILVIEDEPTQRLLTISVLKAAGHQVFEAVDGEAGLQVATTVLPDLIVCDVVMPRLNGYQMVTALKAGAATASIPVIFLSAMNERAHVRVGMSAGADDYLAKPFRATELKQAVDTLLAKRRKQLEQFAEKAEDAIRVALLDQKQMLTGRYEKQLLRELNQRWQVDLESGRSLHYVDTPVLGVDIFGPLVNRLPDGDARPGAIKRVYEATCDALYLFGAQYLLPFGHHLIAIFGNEARSDLVNQKFLAVRAAFAAQKALRAAVDTACGGALPEAASRALAVVALHSGTVMLMRVDDALHGGGATIATGEGVSATVALTRRARELQWPVACSAVMASGIGEMITTGRSDHLERSVTHGAFNALELLSLNPTPT